MVVQLYSPGTRRRRTAGNGVRLLTIRELARVGGSIDDPDRRRMLRTTRDLFTSRIVVDATEIAGLPVAAISCDVEPHAANHDPARLPHDGFDVGARVRTCRSAGVHFVWVNSLDSRPRSRSHVVRCTTASNGPTTNDDWRSYTR